MKMEKIPAFATNRFEGWPGLWVHAERHESALDRIAQLEATNEALRGMVDGLAKKLHESREEKS